MPIFLIVLLFFIVLEGTITTLPFVLVFLVLLMTKIDRTLLISLAFISGIFLDILRVRTVGQTSILLILFFFLIFLYERKYEVKTLPFVSLATFVGTFIFTLTLHLPSVFLSSVFATVLVALGFLLFSKIKVKEIRNTY